MASLGFRGGDRQLAEEIIKLLQLETQQLKSIQLRQNHELEPLILKNQT